MGHANVTPYNKFNKDDYLKKSPRIPIRLVIRSTFSQMSHVEDYRNVGGRNPEVLLPSPPSP